MFFCKMVMPDLQAHALIDDGIDNVKFVNRVFVPY